MTVEGEIAGINDSQLCSCGIGGEGAAVYAEAQVY